MTAVATLPPNASLGQRLSGLESGQRMRLAVGAVIAIAIVIAGIVMGSTPDWRVQIGRASCRERVCYVV